MSAPLRAEEFPAFFAELWGWDAFPWQKEFAHRVSVGDWPRYVAAPTGSGKTACLDAAVFALAVQAGLPANKRTAGRRIFFIVNRRIIVDEAYQRAGEICQKLFNAVNDAPESVTGRVAAALQSLGGDASSHPLIRTQLRGGIYRDRSWAGSLLQPMIICSTVDQAGSRLLFRGYGVTDQARPIHAALVSQDSVLVIDEAHISRPFIETLGWVEKYRCHEPEGCQTVRLPFQLVQMTATLPAGTSEAEQITLTAADRADPVLAPRLTGHKPALLIVEEKAKGKTREEVLAKRLAKEAQQILADHQPGSLAVMANRVATARLVYSELKKLPNARVSLLIGRLRPLDREALTKRIQDSLKTRLKSKPAIEPAGSGPQIVVSTQCLEVGADLDFDALVTEAASLDALRQRFGRLNRGGRSITPHAVIVLPADQDIAIDKLDPEVPCDPIYGDAIPRTWHWLRSIATEGSVDFGINAMADHLQEFREGKSVEALDQMLSPAGHAPVLLPAYLDCWVQTNPAPAADPDIAIFLHGPKREMAEVQVCWRADLPPKFDEQTWVETLSLCPPTSAECLPVPLHIFRDWVTGQKKFEDLSGDADEQIVVPDRKPHESLSLVQALVWAGPEKSHAVEKLSDLAPGVTIVLRAQHGGWQALGILPEAPPDPAFDEKIVLDTGQLRLVDVAERGTAEVRRRAVLRIHPTLWPIPEKESTAANLLARATDKENDCSRAEIHDLLNHLRDDVSSGWAIDASRADVVKHLAELKSASDLIIESYPERGGFVISTRVIMPAKDQHDFECMDADVEALLEASGPQRLCDHTKDVGDQVERAFSLLPLEEYREAISTAATLHDWGKADWRFQALLRSSSVFAAMASGVILAKSGSLSSSIAAWRVARRRAELPENFRHEMLSVQMAESTVGQLILPKDHSQHSLILHLVATHHGYARPLAPVVEDDTPSDASLVVRDGKVLLTGAERLANPAHAIDSGFADRFWQLTRHHGWWGLPYLETVLRLADQRASAEPHTYSKDER